MNILIIGNGGREHALAWKCAQSSLVNQVFIAPGNGGSAIEPNITNVDIDPLKTPLLLEFVRKNNVELTIVGPEAPLMAGIVDQFEEAGLKIFGPSQRASLLEGSKHFTKKLLQAHNIPTAASETFEDIQAAFAYVDSQPLPLVIKADGLASGKGVIIAKTAEKAKEAINAMLSGESFGSAGKRIIIEEFLSGRELSIFALSDGEHLVPFGSAQDYKARDNGNVGPNTGGMGALSPAYLLTPDLEKQIYQTILYPTLKALKAANRPYVGFLYCGIMLVNNQPYVLEYNCRMGDPETQPLLMRLESDLVHAILELLAGRAPQLSLSWHPDAAVGVIMASTGYPAAYDTGFHISGLDMPLPPHSKIFHAGTKCQDNHHVTSGGRVLCVASRARTLEAAREQSYGLVKQIHWSGEYYRDDIGKTA